MGQGDRKAMVLGGSGLVGYQVARTLARQTDIQELVLVARFSGEIEAAIRNLAAEFPDRSVYGFHGDIFMPGRPVPAGESDDSKVSRKDPELRRRLFQDTYQDFETAYRDSMLVQLLLEERPDVVVDCVNTATGISYQDVFTTCLAVRSDLDAHEEITESLPSLTR